MRHRAKKRKMTTDEFIQRHLVKRARQNRSNAKEVLESIGRLRCHNWRIEF